MLVQQAFKAGVFGRAQLELDPGVQIFGVLAEDDHIDVLRAPHGGRHALEPAHRAQAHVQVELAAQGHVERAHPAAHRGGEGAFDAHLELGEGLQGLVRQPAIEALAGPLPGEDLHPGHLAGPAVGALYGRIQHTPGGRPHVYADAIPLDEGDDRVGQVRSIRRFGRG